MRPDNRIPAHHTHTHTHTNKHSYGNSYMRHIIHTPCGPCSDAEQQQAQRAGALIVRQVSPGWQRHRSYCCCSRCCCCCDDDDIVGWSDGWLDGWLVYSCWFFVVVIIAMACE